MQIVGYADRLSVQQGETVRFMVSCQQPRYRAHIVRLIHGNESPKGPGFKEEVIDSSANGEYPGRRQVLRRGSYVLVPDSPSLRPAGSFTLQAWIYPTTPGKGAQGLLTAWSEEERAGCGMVLDADGSLGLWLGDESGRVERASTGQPLRALNWYFVAASYDAASGQVRLTQDPVSGWPLDASRLVVERSTAVRGVGRSGLPFLMAGYWEGPDSRKGGRRPFQREDREAAALCRCPEPGTIGVAQRGDPARRRRRPIDCRLELRGGQRVGEGDGHGAQGVARPGGQYAGPGYEGAQLDRW